MKYIDAEKLIERLEEMKQAEYENCGGVNSKTGALYEVQELITSLQQEQPEVDLDDVIEDYVLENFGERWDGCVPVSCFELNLMAEHFYKLGLNVRKDE